MLNNYLKISSAKNILKLLPPLFWIALAVILVYSQTLFADIVYLDDNVLVVEHYAFNNNMRNIGQAFREDIFRSPVKTGSFYRPLERISFMLDAQFGPDAIVFMSHLSNLLLHLLAVYLFYRFLLVLEISKIRALIFSLIFAVHPLTAQTVAFISGRNDSLLAIFTLPCLFFLVLFWKQKKVQYIIGHFIFLILALFTKETAAVIPFISIAYVILFTNIKKIVFEYKSYLYLFAGWSAILACWFYARWLVLNNLIGNANYQIIDSIVSNFPVLLPTIGKVLLPFHLSVFPVFQDMPKIYGIISIILLGVMFVLAKRKNYRMMIFGGVWFFLFFILTLIKPASTTPDFSENRIYLPMLGFIFIIIGLEPDQILNTFYQNKRKLIAYSSLTILFVIFSSITIYRNRYYINKMNFWQNAVVTSPSFAFNHNNLGAMYYLDNKFALAEEEFQQAITLNANEKLAHNNLGLIYMRNNQFLEAEVEFNKELHINPLYDNAYANLGILFFKMKKLDKGAENFEKVLKINPDRMDALQALAVYYNQKNDLVRATYYANEYNKRAAQLSP